MEYPYLNHNKREAKLIIFRRFNLFAFMHLAKSSCLRLRRFKSLAFVHSTRDVFFSLLVDDSDSSANNSDPNDDSPEPCQAAHIVGGLLRVVARSRFAASRPPLRLRRLQEHVASMLDADWVAYGLQWRHAPGDVERRRFELAQALVKSTQRWVYRSLTSSHGTLRDLYGTAFHTKWYQLSFTALNDELLYWDKRYNKYVQ